MYINCIKLCIIKNWINFENIRNVKINIVFLLINGILHSGLLSDTFYCFKILQIIVYSKNINQNSFKRLLKEG